MPEFANDSAHLTELVPFVGGTLEALRKDGQAWLAIRPACDALGVDSRGQQQRLQRAKWAVACKTHAAGADGKRYEMFCLRSDRVAMWLVSLDAARISDPATRKRIELWQCHAADALDAWARGKVAGTAPADVADHALPPDLLGVLSVLARTNEAVLAELREQRRERRRLERKIAAAERPAPSGRLTAHRVAQDMAQVGRGRPKIHAPAFIAAMGMMGTHQLAEELDMTLKAFQRKYQRMPELRALGQRFEGVGGLWWIKDEVVKLLTQPRQQVGHA